jgi:hypothetical protein
MEKRDQENREGLWTVEKVSVIGLVEERTLSHWAWSDDIK